MGFPLVNRRARRLSEGVPISKTNLRSEETVAEATTEGWEADWVSSTAVGIFEAAFGAFNAVLLALWRGFLDFETSSSMDSVDRWRLRVFELARDEEQ